MADPPPFPLPRPRPLRWRPARLPTWVGAGPDRWSWEQVVARLGSGSLPAAPPAGFDLRARRPAAVLVALWPQDGATRVLLTKRPAHLSSHAGEVSFPGGAVEAGEDPVAAALREADEEVGLGPECLSVVGTLSALPTVGSAYLVTPVVATLTGPPHLRPHPGEVDRVLTVPLAVLTDPAGVWAEEWEIAGAWRPVLFLRAGDDVVWGATARILDELLAWLADAG